MLSETCLSWHLGIPAQIRTLISDPSCGSDAGQYKAAPVTQSGGGKNLSEGWRPARDCVCVCVSGGGRGVSAGWEESKDKWERMTKGRRRDGEHEAGLAQDNSSPRDVPASPLRKDTAQIHWRNLPESEADLRIKVCLLLLLCHSFAPNVSQLW